LYLQHLLMLFPSSIINSITIPMGRSRKDPYPPPHGRNRKFPPPPLRTSLNGSSSPPLQMSKPKITPLPFVHPLFLNFFKATTPKKIRLR
jgi:hypothetical protein